MHSSVTWLKIMREKKKQLDLKHKIKLSRPMKTHSLIMNYFLTYDECCVNVRLSSNSSSS